MKALEILHLVKELQNLLGAKVDKIYQKGNDLILSLHKKGKILLKITPKAMFVTKYKFEQEKPPNFCMYLRKHLDQARITEIIQRNFERIIEIRFKKKEEHIFIIELFSKGNVILCQNNYTIMMPLHEQEWKDRLIKPKVVYKYPPSLMVNPLEAKEKDLEKLRKENLVKSLAIDFGLGGEYAEDVCSKAGVDKNKKTLTKEEIKQLLTVLKSLPKIKPLIMEGYSTISEALDETYKKECVTDTDYERRLKKVKSLLEKQKQHLEELKKDAEENKIKGDLIYKNYSYIEEMINTIKQARDKKFSWEEITKRLKTKGIELKPGGKIITELK